MNKTTKESIDSVKEMQKKMLEILENKEKITAKTKANIALGLSIIATFFTLLSRLGG